MFSLLSYLLSTSLKKVQKSSLQALINYNAFRTWPLNVGTPSGELDEINCAMLVSQKQLVEKGFTNNKGYWTFDAALDRFIINGELYIFTKW